MVVIAASIRLTDLLYILISYWLDFSFSLLELVTMAKEFQIMTMDIDLELNP